MRTRQEVIDFCFSLDDTYEDYPFHDFKWTVMQHKATKRCLRLSTSIWAISESM